MDLQEGGFNKPPRSWNVLNATEKMRRTNRGYSIKQSVFDTFSDGQINSILETKTGKTSAAGGGVTVTKRTQRTTDRLC